MIIQELLEVVVSNMDSNGDSFSFIGGNKGLQNLLSDEVDLPCVYLHSLVRVQPVFTAGGGLKEKYKCELLFAYKSQLDDVQAERYLTLKKCHNAMNQFCLMVTNDADNFETKENVFGEAYQAENMFDVNIDGLVLPFTFVPRDRPSACAPSYSVPVGDCDPVTVQSSAGSFSELVPSGDTLTLSDNDYTITNSEGTTIISGTAEAQNDIVGVLPDVSFTDSDGTVSQVASGKDITATPQVCSGIAGYKGSQPYYTLPSNNHWGHAYRLCGVTGGYTDGVGYFDVNGVATTKALAFPDGLICDLYRVTCDGDFIMYQDEFTLTGNVDFATASAFCASFSLGGFSDWQMLSRDYFDDLVLYYDINNVLSYKPFENTTAVNLWTGTELFFGGTYDRAWIITQYQGDDFRLKIQASARAFPVRVTNISEL